MINADRSYSTPLIPIKNYRSQDVLNSLGLIFNNKCYLCEINMHSPNLFEVDHFIPVNENPLLKLEWKNLYLICSDCNKSRPKHTPSGGLMDPCDSSLSHDVEKEIVYSLPPFSYDEPSFVSKNNNPTSLLSNTIDLLLKIHYGSPNTSIKAASKREAISNQAKRLITLMHDKLFAEKYGDKVKSRQITQQIKLMLDYKAPYTMLMRSIYLKYYDDL